MRAQTYVLSDEYQDPALVFSVVGQFCAVTAAALGCHQAEIRLYDGIEKAYGRLHIEARRGPLIVRMGYRTVEEYVTAICTGWTRVHNAEGSATKERVILVMNKDGYDNCLVISRHTTPSGKDVWSATTALPKKIRSPAIFERNVS